MKTAAAFLLLFAQVSDIPDSAPFEGHVERLHWLTAWEIEEWRDSEWLVISTVTAANDGQPVYFAPLPLVRAFGGGECPVQLLSYADAMNGCQRAGEQAAHTYVAIETENLVENFQGRCEIEYSTWIELRFEDRVTGRYYSNRNTIDCESIEF